MAVGRYTVVRDTREQTPWTFPKYVKTIERTLKTGDYSLWQHTKLIAVERKSLGDWIASITTGWERFQKQLDRLARIDYSCVIVEGLPSRARWKPYHSFKASPSLFLARAAEISSCWGIPLLWSETTEQAAEQCLYFLRISREDIKRRSFDE